MNTISDMFLLGPSDSNRSAKLNPTLHDVLSGIEALDADRNSGLLLKFKDATKPHLAIAGGAGSYVVFIAIDGQWVQHLTNPDMPKGLEDKRIRCGGQMGNIDVHFVVDKTTARMAAEYFYSNRKSYPELTWEPL